jgi:hypothetical protein
MTEHDHGHETPQRDEVPDRPAPAQPAPAQPAPAATSRPRWRSRVVPVNLGLTAAGALLLLGGGVGGYFVGHASAHDGPDRARFLPGPHGPGFGGPGRFDGHGQLRPRGGPDVAPPQGGSGSQPN